MKIKVCGMREPHNIAQLAGLPIHYMGLIFYPPSPRYAGGLDPQALRVLPKEVKRVGVFVNAPLSEVYARIEQYGLSCVQLHGQERVDYCVQLQQAYPGVEIIKVFSVAEAADLANTAAYAQVCNYFLFDTKTPRHGGSGLKFDWDILQAYAGSNPFFLSGGIGPSDTEAIRLFNHPRLYALDLNSRFETEPGIKDIARLATAIAAYQ